MSEQMAEGRSYLVAVAIVMVVEMVRSREIINRKTANKIVGIMGAIAHITSLVAAPANTTIISMPRASPVIKSLLTIRPSKLLHRPMLEWLAYRLTPHRLLRASTLATVYSFLPSLI